MTDAPPTYEQVIAAAVRAGVQEQLDAVVRAIDDDQHEFQARPCETCRFVSKIVGRDFGCVRRCARKAAAAR